MLITTADEIRNYIPISVSATIDKVLPFIDVAENKYLKEILGLDFITDLNVYNVQSAQEEPLMDKVLGMCKRAICYLAYFEGFELLNIKITDAGFHRVEYDADKSLFGYQERNIKDYFATTGYNALEDILEYMEANVDESVFSKWADSDEYQEQRQYFIKSSKEFTKIYKPLKGSRLVYLNILSSLKLAEDFNIKPVLGTELFDTMKELVLDGDIDETENSDYKKLLPYINNALAYFTIAKAAGTLGANFTDKGLFFTSFLASGYKDKDERSDGEKTKAIVNSATETAIKYTEALQTYLDDNIDNLPEYADFIGDDDTTFNPSFDNTDRKIIIT
ncbi:MAG: hypothetical protein A2X13_14725 [Bacteroidetes bacterium GWC2_33_15]|nr:MAG: hypothetical protein A2X10_06790 [Bacteroidetes bacterium GWA2_33_15]OFX50127.1 MAG: hypothetical protein A2X13_14725 [Bacteroidetes bacterium GWC2_33_15]OFX65280.1 MAG: hypothetical protein A2X15_04300 [Bacteroidetes bacterium GWB2_32_14]OFX70506.1 MAG: hypothetical protein A2X14_04355 [Bacteroidetes bacterium GWD2_33_33]HAN19621.1 hypothetical protein [Bacteroidales bacterium]